MISSDWSTCVGSHLKSKDVIVPSGEIGVLTEGLPFSSTHEVDGAEVLDEGAGPDELEAAEEFVEEDSSASTTGLL